MRTRVSVLVAAVAAFVMMAAVARAGDTVWLKNGDRFSGSIVKIAGNALLFKLEFGGEVKIPLAKVMSLASDRPLKLKLADESEVEGRLERVEAGGVVIRAGETSRSLDDLTQLKSVTSVPPPEPDIWTGSLTLGGTVEQGNTREKSAHADLEVEGRWTHSRLSLKGRWNYGEVNGDLDTRDWRSTVQFDRFLGKKLYLYGRNINEADDFEDLKLRVTLGGGAGCQFVESDDLNIRGELGASWSDEDLENGGEDSGFATADGRLKLRYKISDTWSVGEDLAAYQSLKEGDDTRIVSTADMTGKITKDLAITFKVIWEYDNLPSPMAGRQDVKYIAGVIYTFW